MKNKLKVSIVIPIYNGANYMREAIDSALAQTYKNIEIIVVNDGSNDNGETKRIAETYGTKIHYYEKENGGVSTALNLALEKMTGDYFSWLSHDDRYYPNKIETQIKQLENYDDHTILYSDYDLMDENSKIFAESYKDHDELTEKKEYSLLRGAINGITLLIPKKAFSECGNFREDLRCTQDYELWRRMMDKYTFVHEPGILATTRLHQQQTGNTSPRVLSEGNALWIDMIESFSKKDMERLEGTVYKYYDEMLTFMHTTPYTGVIEYLENKLKELDKEYRKESEKVKVSVVIPYYNNSKEEIHRAIQSVRKQSHKNIEIILVDDGSENPLPKDIIQDKNIKVKQFKTNKGVSSARNEGISLATGKYIALLDADDEFYPDKIKDQLVFMLKYDYYFSYTSYVRKTDKEDVKMNCSNVDQNTQFSLLGNCLIATPTVMIEKKFIDAYQLKYPLDIPYGEDNIFYLEIAKKTEIAYYDDYLTNVYVNETSAISDVDKHLTGLKAILKYALNDDFYYQDNEGIGLLGSNIKYLFDTYKKEKIQPPEKRIKRYYKALKNNGVMYCAKKVVEKSCKKMKRNT